MKNQKYRMKSPQKYKTQAGLIKALARAHYMQMDVSLAWWFHNCKWALIDEFGWNEPQASKFVKAYQPHGTKYYATA